MRKLHLGIVLSCACLAALGGYLLGQARFVGLAQEAKLEAAPAETEYVSLGDRLKTDSAAASVTDWERPYPQYQAVGTVLKQFPDLSPGDLAPQELYRYGGAGRTSFAAVAVELLW